MLKLLEDLLRTREQAVELGGIKLHVRELESAADLLIQGEEKLPEGELGWRMLVMCTFGEDGKLAFSKDDIPALKASSKWKLAPLIQAVNKVNGFDGDAEAKNSDAVPG